VEDVSQYGQAPDRLLEENLAAIEELERKKRARKLAHVPTDDRKVRAKLREMGEPITLFGEMVSLVPSFCGRGRRPGHEGRKEGNELDARCCRGAFELAFSVARAYRSSRDLTRVKGTLSYHDQDL